MNASRKSFQIDLKLTQGTSQSEPMVTVFSGTLIHRQVCRIQTWSSLYRQMYYEPNGARPSAGILMTKHVDILYPWFLGPFTIIYLFIYYSFIDLFIYLLSSLLLLLLLLLI